MLLQLQFRLLNHSNSFENVALCVELFFPSTHSVSCSCGFFTFAFVSVPLMKNV